jgi:hypothetical protein
LFVFSKMGIRPKTRAVVYSSSCSLPSSISFLTFCPPMCPASSTVISFLLLFLVFLLKSFHLQMIRWEFSHAGHIKICDWHNPSTQSKRNSDKYLKSAIFPLFLRRFSRFQQRKCGFSCEVSAEFSGVYDERFAFLLYALVVAVAVNYCVKVAAVDKCV